jgi:transposase
LSISSGTDFAGHSSGHKIDRTRQLIEGAHARLLYLPPYSPDLNPIEKAWSKFKQFLRAAKARTVETLDQAVTAALQPITADNAAAWFKHCRYPAIAIMEPL